MSLSRGLRAITDFEYELQIAQTNRKLSNGGLDTIFLTTSLEYAYLSSSSVKEIAEFHGDISQCVPEFVARLVYENMDMSISNKSLYRRIACEGEKDEQQNRTTN